MKVGVILSAALAVLLCACSCSKGEAELFIGTMVVSGTVCADTGEALEDVTVTLMGFGDTDVNMEHKALDTQSARTDGAGRYKITIIGPQAQKYFKIVAHDDADSRKNDAYRSSLVLLYISNGEAYHPRSRTYELKNIDFYLTK